VEAGVDVEVVAEEEEVDVEEDAVVEEVSVAEEAVSVVEEVEEVEDEEVDVEVSVVEEVVEGEAVAVGVADFKEHCFRQFELRKIQYIATKRLTTLQATTGHGNGQMPDLLQIS
jgi:hypothetical protein